VYVRKAGRPGEAGELLHQALAFEEAKLGLDDMSAAVTPQEIDRILREAVEFLQRAPTIFEANVGADDVR